MLGVTLIAINYTNKTTFKRLHRTCANNKDIEFCLISRTSDQINNTIAQIHLDELDNVNFVEIKNNNVKLALKAGARFLLSKKHVNVVGYLDCHILSDIEFLKTIDLFDKTNFLDAIMKYIEEQSKQTVYQRLLLKNTFSILDFIQTKSRLLHTG